MARSVTEYATDTALVARFWAKVNQTGDCWIWTAAVAYGYGRFGLGGRRDGTALAHRVAWELEHGLIPAGLVVDHRCRNRACVRPAHLHLVTRQQNNENRVARPGTSSGVRGVSWCKQTHSWAVTAKAKGQTLWGGRHASLDDAARIARELRLQIQTNNLADRM